jgi:hypothetical protein
MLCGAFVKHMIVIGLVKEVAYAFIETRSFVIVSETTIH